MTGTRDHHGPGRRWILHVDLDEFLAAVEVGRRPELRGRPVVVGGSGDPTEPRKVVATASYEARRFGVRSGMPLRTAARLCPDAVFLPSDPPAYRAASARVMDTLRTFPVVVEVWGWDEAFLAACTDDPEALAADIQAAVRGATGLSCAVGIGDNKLQAKLATGFAKPGGIHRLTSETWMAVMGARPVDALWGIGRKTAQRLGSLGVATVADLAGVDPQVLVRAFGPTIGPYLWALGHGRGGADVTAEPRVARSRSRETTFRRNITDRTEVRGHLDRFARELAAEAAAEGRTVVRVGVKVRYAPFFTRTRIKKLPAPTTDADAIAETALAVLERFADVDPDGSRPVRLLGVRLEFAPA